MIFSVDIAENWSPDGAGAVLPPNIVPSLKKVTTPDGYLTFERFCAGLKIAILRHSAQRHRQIDSSEVTKLHNIKKALFKQTFTFRITVITVKTSLEFHRFPEPVVCQTFSIVVSRMDPPRKIVSTSTN